MMQSVLQCPLLQSNLIEAIQGLIKGELTNFVSTSTVPIEVATNTKFFNTDEAAEKFGVCRTTLYHWRKQGLLPFRRIKSKIFYSLEDLQNAARKIDLSIGKKIGGRNGK
jgi:hypothetical protein